MQSNRALFASMDYKMLPRALGIQNWFLERGKNFFLCNREYSKRRLFRKVGESMLENLAERRVTGFLVEVRSQTLDTQKPCKVSVIWETMAEFVIMKQETCHLAFQEWDMTLVRAENRPERTSSYI